MNFDKWLSTTNAFVNEVANELGIPEERDQAHRIVRSVLHALRARLTAEESMHLLAQLPMLLKAVYVDGWRLSSSADRAIRTEEDFLDEMMRADGRASLRDFPEHADARRAALAVLGALSRQVSEGEMDDVEHGLPRPIRRLLAEARRSASREGEPGQADLQQSGPGPGPT